MKGALGTLPFSLLTNPLDSVNSFLSLGATKNLTFDLTWEDLTLRTSPISSSNDKAKSDEASQGAKISKRVSPMSIIDHQAVVSGRPIQPTVLPIFAVPRRNGLSAFSELESLNGRRHAAMAFWELIQGTVPISLLVTP